MSNRGVPYLARVVLVIQVLPGLKPKHHSTKVNDRQAVKTCHIHCGHVELHIIRHQQHPEAITQGY
jgi:hypothetical protein